MAKTTKKYALTPKEMVSLAENWQRCRQEEIPGLFQAYDTKEEQGERVVTFRMPPKALRALYEVAQKGANLKFIVHLGLAKNHYSERLPKNPPFGLYLQPYHHKSDYQENCFPLSWEANSRFSITMEDDTNSGENAIPAASAYLFVMSWLELADEDLASPFTAVSHVLGKRVKAYVFSEVESASILADIKKSLDSDAPCLDIHLGSGLAVYDHPYSFRPVIEVKHAVDPKTPGKVSRNATGLTDDEGGSYYDFANPVPPNQP